MKIVILGGTGLIGEALKENFILNHEVECMGREAFISFETLLSAVQNCDLVIQLSGANISKRWSSSYKKEIWSSRVDATNLLASVIHSLTDKPKIICASAIGFYPESDCKHPLNETDNSPGSNFLAKLSVAWEAAAKSISRDTIIFRFGVVLSRKGGALKQMYLPYLLGFGGPIKGGNHCFSWIHMIDLIKVFEFILNHTDPSEIYNLTSPQPIKQKYFGKVLAKTLKRPFLVPLFGWQLKLLFGKGSKVLTQSVSVIPKFLLDEGFVFDFPDIESALLDLVQKK
jgi:uncharacterized protein